MSNDDDSICRVRAIQTKDKTRWMQLWKCYLDFYQADVTESITEQTWTTFFADSGHSALVAVNESGDVIGFVTYLFHPSTWSANGYCYLEDLFVEQACRGKGIGFALIRALVQQATDAQVNRVYWHTDTKNVTARKLYDSAAKLSDMVQYRIEK